MYKKTKLCNTNVIKEFKILKIQDKYNLRLALICHRVIHKKENINHAHKNLKFNNDVHERNFRNNLNFYHAASAYTTKNKVTDKASIVWNEMNTNMKHILNRAKFKKDLGNDFLNNY